MTKLGSICVYCGSSERVASRFLDAGYALGRRIGAAGVHLVYGGGGIGLMRRVAEGVAAEGGPITGIIPRHLQAREGAGASFGETVVVESMHERKRLMAECSDGFAVMPGGYGTLDEMFEIVTWRQLGLHRKPVVLVDLDGYWSPLVAMLDRMVEEGFVQPDARQLIQTVTGIEAVLPALEQALSPDAALDGELV
ncbi:MAG TPA: TIGR00730 family Rossman fold protein [Stellaceae bacterium]|nr:TIGR00730 family Rossman fold protein [Stellaceae bacterium]